jgi:vacuolar-type H+-ATPase subunit I/STV1
MGLSASQSRMLTLTARLSDLELKAQRTQEAKIRLAEQSTAASKAYMDALDAQTLKFNYYSTGRVDATVRSITESDRYRVADVHGNSFIFMGSDTGISEPGWYLKGNDGAIYTLGDIDPKNMEDTKWLYEQLQLANLYIQKQDAETGAWEDYSYTSSSIFTTEDDDSQVAQAEAEYEFTMAQIQEKDKRYDLDLDNINTEHDAVKTEMESVKGVIKDNVSKTFTIFS